MSFYTYAHSSPKGKIFYIGKGIDDRAYSFSDRSVDWKRAVKYHNGLNIQILAYWDTEKEAFEHEKVLIDSFVYMGYPLVNLTKGGKGPYGIVFTEKRKQYLRTKLTGLKHEKITCPKCKKTGGVTSMKRWHFDKCTGNKQFKARTTINGKRIYLGYFETKDQVDAAIQNAKQGVQ